MGRFRFRGQIWLGMNNSKSVHFRVVNTGQERGEGRSRERGGQVRTVLFMERRWGLQQEVSRDLDFHITGVPKIPFMV